MRNRKGCTVLTWVIGMCLSFFGHTSPSDAPNIIIIMADDLGYNDLSCYRTSSTQQTKDSPTCQTPNIDALAKKGMRFTDFYSGAAVCSPSRAALLTGRNATRVGLYNHIPLHSPMHLRDEEVTIAEMIKTNGYQTAHFGKWHLTSTEDMGQPGPGEQGFDYSFFTFYNAKPSQENPVNFIRNGREVGKQEGYSCQLVVDEAMKWLKDRNGQDAPFYMNIWFHEPHEIVAAPDELKARHSLNPTYNGAVENMDNAVGRLIRYLEENDLNENTIIIFTSDNGSYVRASNIPLKGGKSNNYEGGIRVPFIVRYDGFVPPATINNAAGAFVDVLPTISAITGAQIPDRTIDGGNISSMLLNRKPKIDRPHSIFFYRYMNEPACMLRSGNWVLLGLSKQYPSYDAPHNFLASLEFANLKPEAGVSIFSMWSFNKTHMQFIENQQIQYFELYDITKDIDQRHDLKDQYPEIAKQLREEMLSLREEMLQDGGNWFLN